MQLWITGRLHSLEAPWLQRATPASVYDKFYLLYHIRSTFVKRICSVQHFAANAKTAASGGSVFKAL
jgi:hypothetical protein